MPVRYLDSSQTSAPDIGRSVGTLITFLDAVLVNGYGAYSSLGWTKLFSGTNKAIYRQGGWPYRLLYVDDSAQADYVQGTNLFFCQSAQDVNTPVNKFMPNSGTYYLYKCETKVLGGSWAVIGDEFGFYLLTSRAEWNQVNTVCYFGEPIYAGPANSDTGATVIFAAIGHVASGAPSSNQECITSTAANFTLTYGGGYIAGDPFNWFVPSGYTLARTLSLEHLLGYLAYPNDFQKGALCSPIYLGHPSGIFRTGSYDFRGALPGLYKPYHSLASFFPPNKEEYTYTSGPLNGKTLQVRYVWTETSVTSKAMFFEISNTWR